MTFDRKYPLTEVCEKSGIEQSFVVHCIRSHWIVPTQAGEVQLDDEDIARLQLIWELQEEMGVNEEAIPIILHLLDQLHAHRRAVQEWLKEAG